MLQLVTAASSTRCGDVPAYRITINNENFSASEDIEVAGLAAARIEALRGALNIGTDQVCQGKVFFGAEISIQENDGTPLRLMVAIGTTPLQ